LCNTIQIDNQEQELSEEWKTKFEDVYTKLGNFGERVLGFCDCLLPLDKFPSENPVFDTEHPEEFLALGFRFVGLISLVDPPKYNVPEAVRMCRSAGIKVVMVTGDHPLTAAAVARSVNIISKGLIFSFIHFYVTLRF
jgi:sodium/potassium-transporting ATPase subunit alpha